MIKNTMRFFNGRLFNRPDQEHQQAAIRVVLVIAAIVYFFSDRFVAGAVNEDYARFAQIAALFAGVTTVSLAIAMLINPGVSVSRRVIGMVHDIVAISAAMYFGEGGAAGAAAAYLWVTLGNGFRYGNAYLYSSTLLSIVAFGAVSISSTYWQMNTTLSANILILLALIPPYVGALLNSLQKAKTQLRRQASIDVLTELMNRAATEMTVERVLDEKHDGHTLLFCDLDHFKQVNDKAGHAAGDKLLKDVAQIIQDCCGERAVVGRLGGDEFCVFLPDCTIDKGRQLAEQVRNSVSGYRLAWGRDYYSVGISVGVAPSGAVQDMGSLFRLADAACYAAKNAGRNQVHIVDPMAGLADTQRIRSMFADTPLGATGAVRIVRAGS